MIADTVVVRLATAADLPAVDRIERESFNDPWSMESFTASLALGHMRFLVGQVHGETDGSDSEVVAYVIALLLGHEAEILDIAVAGRVRCQGLGGLLLNTMIADLAEDGARTIFLEVRESNHGARALYRSRSFMHVGRRRAYYRDPVEDALVLRREIAPT